jgi:tetratricopeptide (TPR) repeat protein
MHYYYFLGELSPVFGKASFAGIAVWFFIILLVLAIGAALRALVKRKFSARTIIVLVVGALAFTGRRNIVLFALIASPFITEAATGLRLNLKQTTRNYISIVAGLAMLTFSYFPLSGSYYFKAAIPARWGLGVTSTMFPHKLPDFLNNIRFEGQILNSSDLGGFYLYHSYPGRVPFTDGRWEIYDPQSLSRAIRYLKHEVKWKDIVKEFQIKGILVTHYFKSGAETLLRALYHSDDFRLIYLDQAASFWIFEDRSNLLPDAINLNDPSSLPILDRAENGFILDKFFIALNKNELRLANLKNTLAFGFRKKWILEQIGLLQIETKRFNEALSTFSELLQMSPENPNALNELAFLYYHLGDIDRAKLYMEKLLKLFPDNKTYKKNYNRLIKLNKNK